MPADLRALWSQVEAQAAEWWDIAQPYVQQIVFASIALALIVTLLTSGDSGKQHGGRRGGRKGGRREH